MMTGVGSPNDVLWSQMEQAGWTRRIAIDDLPTARVTSSYAFTDAGARAVTKELTAIVTVKIQMMGMVKGFDPRTAPELVQQLCGAFSWLALRTASQLALAKEARPASGEAQARQHACILALDEINKGVAMAGLYIADAIAHGPDSDAGRDCLERTTAGLRYAEQCLTQWATEMRAEQSGSSSLPT